MLDPFIGAAERDASLLDSCNELALLILLRRERNIERFEVGGLRSATVAVAGRDGAERSLLISGAKHDL